MTWESVSFWLTVSAIALGGIALATPAPAHEPRSGLWTYPSECCQHSEDCHWIPINRVQFGPAGAYATIIPSDHPHASKRSTYFFSYDAIRVSGDSDAHLCLGQWDIPRCIYLPPQGV